MGTTANDRQNPIHGVNEVLGNSIFDLNQGLAAISLRRDGPRIYNHFKESECNDPSSSTSQMPRSLVAGDEPFWTPEYAGWVPGGAPDPNSGPMRLLNLEKKQKAALSEIYLMAKVEGNRITTTDYVVVLKLFLRDFMLSENRIEVVPHPEAYALLLSRLSGELGTCSFDADSMLDPADHARCMAELLKDMKETWEELRRDTELLKGLKEMWGPDVCVYVRRAIDKYSQCLLAVADALNS